MTLRGERNTVEFGYAVGGGEQQDPRASRDPNMAVMKHRGCDVPLKSLHMVGVLRGGALHLHPVHSMQLVRPDLGYLDASLLQGGGTTRATESRGGSGAVASVKLDVHFKRMDERALATRRSSYAHWVSLEEGDPPLPLAPVGASSPAARNVLSALTSTVGFPSPSKLESEGGSNAAASSSSTAVKTEGGAKPLPPVTSSSLLRALTVSVNAGGGAASPSTVTMRPLSSRDVNVVEAAPERLGGNGGASAGASADAAFAAGWLSLPASVAASIAAGPSMSLSELADKPPAVQVEDALRRACVLPFWRLIAFASSAKSGKEVLEHAVRTGRLVAGAWVLKSELEYGLHWTTRLAAVGVTDTARGGRGAPKSAAAAAQLQLGLTAEAHAKLVGVRDLLLIHFGVNPTLDIDAFCASVKLPLRAVRPMLVRLASKEVGPQGTTVWRFKGEPTDGAAFSAAFPHLVESAARWARAREDALLAAVGLKLEGAARVAPRKGGRGRADSMGSAAGSEGDVLPEDAESARLLGVGRRDGVAEKAAAAVSAAKEVAAKRRGAR